ncbi:hypothetical protein PPERSA_02771 [Pseudocohnilembus persalinus]|uniref:TerD domain-containing protein n=1 Tax=Pseudocohnilembus persalinus TaxID=266149 RepID=A0A0V0Q902_PSEPJ|nr:hypothetical protein PPERSA_02771 [Pseudocohnilembus persalinus]|eukprot:KRW98623.1 hypothetical protein PPERSA_02771 [Pseudocohnilembus persalinus]
MGCYSSLPSQDMQKFGYLQQENIIINNKDFHAQLKSLQSENCVNTQRNYKFTDNKKQQIRLNQNQQVKVEIKWDDGCQQDEGVDLDLSCCFIDNIGGILDAVFYNKVESDGGAVKHSGDQQDQTTNIQGVKQDDFSLMESITVDLDKIQNRGSIHNLSFIICSHNQQVFDQLNNVKLFVKQGEKIIKEVKIDKLGQFTAYMPGFLYFSNQENTWYFYSEEQVGQGKTFEDCQQLIYDAMTETGYDGGLLAESENWKSGKNKFLLKKGQSIKIPQVFNSKVSLGLGWDAGCDVDASVLMFDKNMEFQDIVYYHHLTDKFYAVKHTGDNLTGEGDGDDELLHMNLDKLPEDKVDSLWCLINVYTNGKQFDDVRNPYARILINNQEMARFNLAGNKDGLSNGCIVCTIQRYNRNQWFVNLKEYYTQNTRMAKQNQSIISDIVQGDMSKIKILDEEIKVFDDKLEPVDKKKKTCFNFLVKSAIITNDNCHPNQKSTKLIINVNEKEVFSEKVENVRYQKKKKQFQRQQTNMSVGESFLKNNQEIIINQGVQVYVQHGDQLFFRVKNGNVNGVAGFVVNDQVLDMQQLFLQNIQIPLYTLGADTKLGYVIIQMQKQNY